MGFVKVLPLEFWQKEFNNKDYELEEIDPIFHRDGYYLSKDGLCWFEVNGRAYLYEEREFRFQLNLLSPPCLSLNQLDALRRAVRYRIASKEQIKLLQDIEYLKERHRICLEVTALVRSVRSS